MELPQTIKDSLNLVLAYCSDEYEDYYRKSHENNCSGDARHIYEDIALVREWLESPHLSVEQLQSKVNQHLEDLRLECAA